MSRLAPYLAVSVLLGACATSPPVVTPAPPAAPSNGPVAASTVAPPAAVLRSSVTFDSNFAFDIRPMTPFAPLLQRVGSPAGHAGANTYHWNGAEDSELDVETLGDKIHRATVTTPDGTHLIIEPETSGQNVLAGSRSAASAISQSALGAVNHWAQVWSAKDVDAYLACYAPDFHTPGATREQWLAQRRQRLQSASAISVQVQSAQVEPIGDTRVRIRFVQHYSSSTHRDVTRKTLELWLLESRWRIVGETSR